MIPSKCINCINITNSAKGTKKEVTQHARLSQLKYGLTTELYLPHKFLFIHPISSKER